MWVPLERELTQWGLHWNTLLAEMPVNLGENGYLLRLRDAVQQQLPGVLVAEINRRKYATIEAQLRTLQHMLDISNGTGIHTGVVQQLRNAVNNGDPEAYHEAFDHLVDLHERQRELALRSLLLTRLGQCAPGWAAAIRSREGAAW